MISSALFRTVGALGLALTLSACVDVNMELQVVDETSGAGSTTMIMDREFYDMSVAETGGGGFCDEDGVLTLTEDAATCVSTESGTFDQLFSGDEGEPVPSAVKVGDGLVRVTFPTGTMANEFGGEDSDPQEMAMLQTFFEGHNITLKISGGEIMETNMDVAEDGQSASVVIPFLDLISGGENLPDESFAVVNLN